MPRAFATLTLLAVLASIAPQPAPGQIAPSRRPFLFKDNRGDIATAHARGDTALTVIIAAMPGATGQLAQTIQGMGGSIRFRDDQVDYIRARVPVDSVERLAHDPSVHSLDITMKGADRGFGASGTESFAPGRCIAAWCETRHRRRLAAAAVGLPAHAPVRPAARHERHGLSKAASHLGWPRGHAGAHRHESRSPRAGAAAGTHARWESGEKDLHVRNRDRSRRRGRRALAQA